MLTFNLSKKWYEKIRSGEKTIEYREVKPYWTKRLNGFNGMIKDEAFIEKLKKGESCNLRCILRLGYTKRHMTARIKQIYVLQSGKDTDLAIDGQVYAIHLADIREVEVDE